MSCSFSASRVAQSSTSFASVPVSVYWILRAAHPRGDLDVLHRLEVDGDAGDGGDRLLQPRR